MKRRVLAAAIFFTLIAITACQTVPTEIPDDLTQAELIQLAQDSADQENWDAAIAYYEAIRSRFSEDLASSVVSQYEIAFIEYKRGNPDAARQGFQVLVEEYETNGAALPAWPLILAEKLLAEIDPPAATAEG